MESDYLQAYCPKCGARLGHVEGDFTRNVVIYRPCMCEATMLADDGLILFLDHEDSADMVNKDWADKHRNCSGRESEDGE